MCSSKECIEILKANLPRIQSEFGVTGLCLFGSVARGDNRPDSDVDILVDMPPKLFTIIRLKHFLESILNNTVDLIHHHSRMNPRFLNEVLHDGITIL